MQPININERRSAFWNFFLLFMVSIIIIATTLFFSTRVSLKQNDQLLTDLGIVEKEREFSNKFRNEMLGITAMLDTINTKASKQDLLDGVIAKNISELNLMVDADSGYNKVLYKHTVLTLEDLRDSKKQLRALTGKEENMGDLQKINQELTQRLDAAITTIELQRKTIHEMQKR